MNASGWKTDGCVRFVLLVDLFFFPVVGFVLPTGGLQDATYPSGDSKVPHVRAAAATTRGPGHGAKDTELPRYVLHRGETVRAAPIERQRGVAEIYGEIWSAWVYVAAVGLELVVFCVCFFIERIAACVTIVFSNMRFALRGVDAVS